MPWPVFKPFQGFACHGAFCGPGRRWWWCWGLAACAAPPIPYDRQGAGGVQTIGVLTPYMSEQATVFVWGSPGRMFGLVGALAEAAAQSAREGRVKGALDSRQFQARPVFEEALGAALTTQGYRVVPVTVARSGRDFLDRYSGLPEGPEAWLDCFFVDWGYFAATGGDDTPYRPYLNVTCRLVRAKDGAVLMRDRVIYNWFFNRDPPMSVVTLPPDPQFSFRTSDDLVAEPDRAVAGLVAALRAAAGAVGTVLK